MATELMSHSRFSSVPPLILPLSLSLPPHPVSAVAVGLQHNFRKRLPPPPPRVSTDSPFLARGCSFGGVCDHLDLRFVGELGGQISVTAWAQKFAVCCVYGALPQWQASLRPPPLLLSRPVVRSIDSKQFVKQESASGLRCFRSSLIPGNVVQSTSMLLCCLTEEVVPGKT